MSSKTATKAIPDSEWESHKDTIKSLYLADNLKLKGPGGVIAYMTSVHMFSASEAQYETRLRKWRFYKNRSPNGWKSLGKKIAQRRSAGKASDVYMNNKLVPTTKVQKQIARYSSPPALEKSIQASSPRTPEGFVIRTPEAEVITLPLQIWMNDLPFFQLEAKAFLEINGPMVSARNTGPLEFVDPKVLHSCEDDTPGLAFETRSITGDLRPNIFQQIGRIQQENVPNSEQLFTMLKSLLPQSVLDNHLARRSSLTQLDEDLKADFARLIVFSTANNFVDFDNIPINLIGYLSIFMDTGLLQSLQRTQGPESEAFVENCFTAAIESKDAGVVKFLLLHGALDCNKLVCTFQGKRYTPVERASQLRSTEVIRHLIDAGADVNKILRDGEQVCGALPLAIQRWEQLTQVDLELVRLLLQAGAEVSSYTLQSAINQVDLKLVELLIDSRVSTSRAEWIQHGVLSKAIRTFDNQSAIGIVTSIMQTDGPTAYEVCPADVDSLLDAVDEAAKHGSLELVQFLLGSAVPLSSRALNLAVTSGNHELVQLFLGSGVHPTSETLSLAVKSGNNELVQLFLGSGIHPTNKMLSLAVESGNQELLQSLLDAEVYTDRFSTSGTTPLADAIRSRNRQMLELLESKDAWARITKKSQFIAVLKAASEVGEIEIVRHLLSNTAKFKATELWAPLQAAILRQHEAIVEMLLDAGAEVNFETYGEEPLLINAIRNRNPNVVRSILEADANVNATGRTHYKYCGLETAILTAVEWGDHTILEDLIARGADVNAFSAFTASVNTRDISLVQILLNAGAEINGHLGGEDQASALEVAVENSDIDMTQFLLSNGADPNDSNALLVAMLYSKPLFEKLLEAFTRKYPCGKNGFGSGALAMAVLKGDLELMEKLLSCGADPDAFVKNLLNFHEVKISEDMILFEGVPECELDSDEDSNEGEFVSQEWNHEEIEDLTPLGLAITKDQGKNVLVVQRLLEAGGNPNGIVHRGRSTLRRSAALLAAIQTKSLPMVQLLIKAGAKVNCPAAGGVKRTPLQQAAEIGCFDIVQSLLDEKASVNAGPSVRGGGTALQLAAIGGYVGIAELLLQWGADPNGSASKVNGRNAIEGAAEHGRIDMLKVLYNAGAKLEWQLVERACSLAEENGHLATKNYLRFLYSESLPHVALLSMELDQDITGRA